MTGFLTQKELEDIADNLNLDESDIETDLIPNYDEDDDEEDLLGEFPLPDDADADPIDDFDSSDDEPLIHLVPSDKRNWISSNNFQPPAIFTNHSAQSINYIDVVLEPSEYFSKYLDADFFEKVALFTNVKEVNIFVVYVYD